MKEHQKLALKMIESIARQQEIQIVEINDFTEEKETCVIMSFGSGLLMSYLDTFVDAHEEDFNILAIDLGGKFTVESRVAVIDYAATAFNSILLLWSSLRSADSYLDGLIERDCRPKNCTVYLKGLGEDNSEAWVNAGFHISKTIFKETIIFQKNLNVKI